MVRWKVWPLALVTFAACDLGDLDVDCDFDRDLSEFIGVTGTDRLTVDAEQGDLRVEGRPGLNQVRVRGVACAEDLDDLDDVALIVQRSGSSIRVFGLVPSGQSLNARLDLFIEVPDWMLVDIDHDSGDIEVDNVSGLIITDDSGNIHIQDVFGDVDVRDGSGLVWVRNVEGDVFLLDDSGDIDVRDVAGSVRVEEDGSGDIFVSDVGGNFTVEFDGSGNIVFRNVRGVVTIPN